MVAKFKIKKTPKQNNPFPHSTLHERLLKAKAVDMRDNYYIEELENCYVRVKPIDPTKLYK